MGQCWGHTPPAQASPCPWGLHCWEAAPSLLSAVAGSPPAGSPLGGPSRVLTPSPTVSLPGSLPDADSRCPRTRAAPSRGDTHTHTHTHLCTLYELAGSLSSQHLLPIPPLYPVPVVPKGPGLGTSPPSPPPCSCMAPDTGQRVRLVVLLPQTIKPRWSVQGVLALLPGPAWGSQRSLGRGHCNLHCAHGAVQETRDTSKTPLCPPWVHPARPPGPAQTPSGC